MIGKRDPSGARMFRAAGRLLGACCRGGFALNTGTGERVPLACNSPRCPICGPARAATTCNTFEASGLQVWLVTLTWQDSALPDSVRRLMAARGAGPVSKAESAMASRAISQDVNRLTAAFRMHLKRAGITHWLRANEWGTNGTHRLHVHYVLGVPATWGRREAEAFPWPGPLRWADDPCPVVGADDRGFYHVKVGDSQRLAAYLCGDLAAFGKVTEGRITRSKGLLAAERAYTEFRNELLGRVAPVGEFEYLGRGEEETVWQETTIRELRVLGRTDLPAMAWKLGELAGVW